MADYYQTFAVVNAHQVYAEFLRMIDYSRARGERHTARLLEFALVEFRRDMATLAEGTKARSEAEIEARIRSTARRAEEVSGRLVGGIVSDVIEPDAAIVGIGRISGGGGLSDVPYWRAQEYGLREGFVGRVIHGYFDGGGLGRLQPLHAFSGRGVQPEFTLDSSSGGFGTIRHPIQPRRFMERGAKAAERYWQAGRQKAVNRAVRTIQRAITVSKAP